MPIEGGYRGGALNLAARLCSIAAPGQILASETVLMAVVVSELEEVKASYNDARRTEIIDVTADIDVEDMIAPEGMVVTVTHGGYVKRSPKNLYKAQKRGGRGITGAATDLPNSDRNSRRADSDPKSLTYSSSSIGRGASSVAPLSLIVPPTNDSAPPTGVRVRAVPGAAFRLSAPVVLMV